jgi:hypothetical protein
MYPPPEVKMSAIEQPGIYTGIPNSVYHGDLTPALSLSSSGVKKLLTDVPARFWVESPLNPEREKDDPSKALEFGTAAHLFYLEPDLLEQSIVRIDAKDYKKKEAQELRDAARADGKVPLLLTDVEKLEAMRKQLFAHPIAKDAFIGGISELTLVWKDPETGVWCKCRPDYSGPNFSYIADYKTTTDANPESFAKRAWDLGYHHSAAWYLDGIRALTGEAPKRFYFVSQEKTWPFFVSVSYFDDDVIAAARLENRRAVRIFAECMASGKWPGYEGVHALNLPAWAQRQVDTALAA